MSGAIYNDFSQFSALRADATKNPNAALEEVAAQFESIFLQQMLKSMRDATVKSDLFDSSQMETYQSMADQQLALQLSEQGGIGLARMMVEQMQTSGLVEEVSDSGKVQGSELRGSQLESSESKSLDKGLDRGPHNPPDEPASKEFRLEVANAYELRSDD
jgi:flagellar protein FlgJ